MDDVTAKQFCSCGARRALKPKGTHRRTPHYAEHGMTFCPHCDRITHPPAAKGVCANCDRSNTPAH